MSLYRHRQSLLFAYENFMFCLRIKIKNSLLVHIGTLENKNENIFFNRVESHFCKENKNGTFFFLKDFYKPIG